MTTNQIPAKAYESAHAAICEQSLDDCLDPDWRGKCVKAVEAAAPYILAGATIATEEELDALPVGSVVLSEVYHNDVDGMAVSFQRWYDGDWHRGSRCGDTHPDNFLPATVLHRPTA